MAAMYGSFFHINITIIVAGVVKDETILKINKARNRNTLSTTITRYCMYMVSAISMLQHVSKKDRLDVVRGEMMIDHQRDGQSIRTTSRTWVRRQVCRFTCEDRRSRISNLSIMFSYAGQRIINGRGGAILCEYSERWELGCAFGWELHATLNHVGPPASTDTDIGPHEADPPMLELSSFPLIAAEYITENANSHILHIQLSRQK